MTKHLEGSDLTLSTIVFVKSKLFQEPLIQLLDLVVWTDSFLSRVVKVTV